MPQRHAGTPPRPSGELAAAVADYRPGQFLFASPRATLVTRAPLRPLAPGTMPLGQRARQALHDAAQPGTAAPLLVGAVPFDVTQPARLAVGTDYLRGGPVHAELAAEAAPWQAPLRADALPWPAPRDFEAAVRQALVQLEAGPLSKVVLARTLRLCFDGDLELGALLSTLLRRHPQAYTYAVPLAATNADAAPVFLGATPELLVRREGARVFLNPLAGSAARRRDPGEDAAVAQALAVSAKDLREHAVVVDAIADVLRPLCHSLRVPKAPSLLSTDALWHLSTEIEGELHDPALTSLDLALALHPTPAVCGQPLAAAQCAIAELEPFDRSLFAGFVGWMDAHGDGEWAVALRCAECAVRGATLYAGAGIVAGSDPERECHETQTKFRTMLSAMGVGEAIAVR